MPEKEKQKEIVVVRELPTQPVREFIEEDKQYELITTEEAIKEILIAVREIKKSVS